MLLETNFLLRPAMLKPPITGDQACQIVSCPLGISARGNKVVFKFLSRPKSIFDALIDAPGPLWPDVSAKCNIKLLLVTPKTAVDAVDSSR